MGRCSPLYILNNLKTYTLPSCTERTHFLKLNKNVQNVTHIAAMTTIINKLKNMQNEQHKTDLLIGKAIFDSQAEKQRNQM